MSYNYNKCKSWSGIGSKKIGPYLNILHSITEGEKEFLHKTGIIFGASKHLSNPDQQTY